MTGQFVTVAEGRAAAGMRLVVTQGIPNPWGEAAKGIFHVKGIDHVRVPQIAGDPNTELVAWTGINSGPIAVFADEPARAGWIEILMLAERIAPSPRLVPADEAERATMFGLAHELCSEDGYGWNRRLKSFAAWQATLDETKPMDNQAFQRMNGKYGHGGDIAHARQRIIAILGLLGQRLRAQESRGSRYYMGDALTAIDIYSACFMAMVKPLPIELCPTSAELHAGYHEPDPDIVAIVDPILLDHRDFIYHSHLELPMRL